MRMKIQSDACEKKKTNQQEIVEKAANLFKTANLHAEINSLIEFLKQLELVKN